MFDKAPGLWSHSASSVAARRGRPGLADFHGVETMKRYLKFLVNIPIIAGIIGAATLYNYSVGVRERHAIHREIMGRMMETPHAKELKPVAWEIVENSDALADLDGKEVVLAGYGFPLNEDHVRDLGSVGLVGMDPCCDKPITYRNVTALDLSPLPYHTYFWKKANVTVEVDLEEGSRADFMADSPSFFRGVAEIQEEDGRTRLALKNAQRVDTSKGSAFGKAPPRPVNAPDSQDHIAGGTANSAPG